MTKLRTSVMQAVRRGHWTGDDAENTRGIARISMRAASTGLDHRHYDVALALAVIATSPFASPHEEIKDAMAAARDVLAGAAVEDHRLVSPLYGRFTTKDAVEACQADHLAAIESIRMEEPDADAKIRAEVDRLKPLYPALNLSFGYIGNWSPQRDDRGFRVFTTLATPECAFGCDVTFGNHGAADLGLLLRQVRSGLEDWCRAKQDMLDARRLRQVRRAA